MIIGLIGPVNSDIEEVLDLLKFLSENKKFQVIDSTQLLRAAGHKLTGSLTTKDYYKKYALKKLESTFGTVIVTGNIILSEDICEWLLSEGNLVAVVSRDKMEDYDDEILSNSEKYWGEPETQKYNLEERFKMVYNRLQKTNKENLYLIDIISEDTSVLESLMESSKNWEESKYTEDSYDNIINLINVERRDNMTIEESIKKAMRDLGMDVDDEAPVEAIEKPVEPKKSSIPKPVKPKVIESAKPMASEPKENFMNTPTDKAEDEKEEEEEQVDSLFVKITDTTMALLIPVGLKLEKQTIGDMEFNVAAVNLPDFNNRKLQELQINKQEPEKPSKPVNSKPEKVVKAPAKQEPEKPVKTTTELSSLEELKKEKAELDAEIKKYRAAGDLDMVNALRKKRHVVRNKINHLK